MLLKGYVRVSTCDQNPDLQVDALIKAGCNEGDIITDKASGAVAERPGLNILLNHSLRTGDTLVVWRLDRLARSLKMLIELVESLHARGIHLKSVQEKIDTTTSEGKLTFHIFCALAEFERNLIKERTQAGLAAARARGRHGGRPRSLDKKKAALAKQLYAEKNMTVAEICQLIGVSRPTLYRYIRSST